ncbi:MAG TPA: hypothetical protein VL284_07125 [Thermoanaerobaculia bacterium]|nr:hypothetical protein [Thermoanaerobaculia bacterium]
MRTFAVAVAILAASVPAFPQTPPTNMLGPLNPARAAVLSPGTLLPVDDPPIVPFRASGTQITLSNPWETMIDANNTFTLSNLDGGGRFLTASRTTTSGLVQSITITGFTSGTPSAFVFSETGGPNGPQGGTGQLVQDSMTGMFNALHIAGSTTPVNATLNFVYLDTNGDGFADWISIPWSEAGLLGVNFNNEISGIDPQVWVPLADTDGDGKGDAIVVDLDGDGTPDPDLHQSAPGSFGPMPAPSSIATNVPTLSEWVTLLLILTLMAVALWQLRRVQPPAAGV